MTRIVSVVINPSVFTVNIMKRLAVLAALLAMITGVAQAKSEPAKRDKDNGHACIFISSIGQYRVLDDRNLVIWGPGRRDAYWVELSMPLFGLNSSFEMATIDHDRDGRLCGFGMDRIGARNFNRPESSTIARMTRLDDAGFVSLEEKYKVKLRSKPKQDK